MRVRASALPFHTKALTQASFNQVALKGLFGGLNLKKAKNKPCCFM